jgi:flagellar hook protein FlgE
MDVIANNIANVNTTGFKASRMTFADTFSQTMQGASGPQPLLGRGGTNPMQVGLGVNVSSIQRLMSQGGAMRTDDPFHMMIDGDGFFVVGDNAGGLLFTRAGDFRRDRDYNIVMPNGLMLHGWPARMRTDGDGNPLPGLHRDPLTGQTIIDRQPVQGIQITPEMRTVPGSATGSIVLVGNLVPAENNIESQINFHDSLGNVYTVGVTFSHVMHEFDPLVGPVRVNNTWEMTFESVGYRQDGTQVALDPIGPLQIVFRTDGSIEGVFLSSAMGVPVGLPAGGPFVSANPNAPGIPPFPTRFGFGLDGATLGVVFGQPNPPGPPPGPNEIVMDFTALTQMDDGSSSPVANDIDGMAMGTLIGLSVGPDGVITGTYSNGQAFALWQIAVARFANPAGLESVGNNLFTQTSNSGLFDNIGFMPGAISSTILGGTLEMSNVDLASEFTEMITTQRGFQANSRVITTSDEILQELVNLRR